MRHCSWLLLLSHVACGLLLAGFSSVTMARFPGETERQTADFFVAVDGSDDWSGHLAEPNRVGTDGPFATLARARDAVRKLKQDGGKKEVGVRIRGGVYRLEETMVFSSEDSAPAGGTITYEAYGDEKPVFASAVPIVGWRKPKQPSALLPEIARDQVWTADVPPKLSNVLTLYDKNHRLPRASSKPFTPVSFLDPKMPHNEIAFPSGAMKNWPDLKNVELFIIPSCDYEMCLLTGLSWPPEKAAVFSE